MIDEASQIPPIFVVLIFQGMSDNELKDREEQKSPVSFIEQFIIDDLKDGKNNL